ncbi:MAG: hypothetical protein H6635_05725 [Anaerolineales bacterium]|nr:hypothetical protein [Anaerolineales bacterium]MCB9144849.1 hypothetical protein [Anaerolineales bacterium]
MNSQLHEKLAQLLGERFITSEHEHIQHGKDESSHMPTPPDAVCYPLDKQPDES